ncbi:GNAT family N-acetyltransferase [Streptomyces sp. NPDC059909]|uniref:GNAT family N-acetyltransferase n=1 Tax=Streptomyces sp. NPDC059909 TaxID=3346998 RepID=UPI0036491170
MNRHMAFDRLHNFRDLGGYRTEDGRHLVRWGRLYRSDSLAKLGQEQADRARFEALGIRTVIDLRYPWEIEAKGRVPRFPGLAYHNLSIEHRPYDQAALGPEVDPGPYLAARFMEVAEDGFKEIRQVLDVIAAEDHQAGEAGPVVFHCASGKDRTGLIAALVLSLIGVSEDDIVADFALTGLATERLLDDWRAANPGREPVWPGYGRAPAEIMRLFLDALAQKYGSVRAYAAGQLGIDDAFVAALRARLLVPAGEPELSFRRADESDVDELVRLRDEAARWQIARGIDQWKPRQLGTDHFLARLREGEVWIATLGSGAGTPVVGAWELWWEDPAAWGPQPPVAGYIHRLMVDRRTAPPGTGRRLLAEAERRIAAAGRSLSRLDCLTGNPRLRRYYEDAGYAVVGELAAKDGGTGDPYAVTLFEKPAPAADTDSGH